MIFKDSKVYDILKWIALTVLPAIEALWLTLGGIWNFPYVTEIGATIAAVDVFLGALLGISNVKFKKNEIMVANEDCNENQMLMMENMLEEDEQQMIKGE